MGPLEDYKQLLARRHFLASTSMGIGSTALASMLASQTKAASPRPDAVESPTIGPHFAPKAKRVICLFQSGGPAQMDMFDYKPRLAEMHGEDLPSSVRMGQRLTRMTVNQKKLPLASSIFKFKKNGQSGTWMSEVLPHLSRVVDDMCVINSMHTEAINHDPGATLFQTGSQQPGLPSMGAWSSYGLGSETEELPAFVALISQGSSHRKDVLPLTHRYWGNGFLESKHQGIKFRSSGDPVLYLADPAGANDATRRRLLDELSQLNQLQYEQSGDPETLTRIAQYELAFRMQTSVPELMATSSESESTFTLYGPDSRKPGSYAANCLLARRLVERGVRFVNLYHRGWDQHDHLPADLGRQCRDVDQASAALISDLKQRGMLDETLVIWGTEFGRTAYCQGKLERNNYGRDHHPRCFSVWMAGGGIQGGLTYGRTDDFCYNVVENPVHIRDMHATILHCLGMNHKKLTYKFQGLDQRLTGVEEEAQVLKSILT